ncbi:MAG TPA: N-acetylglucosamine-6-phosphate deacetylase [Candidatus Angelobacter sp.]|nr:N-acetylglucosamine-6-phosphate deacetylase [Candidatus Angelobacter sp.]
MTTIITAAHLITPTEWVESPLVVVDDGRIITLQSRLTAKMPSGGRHLDFPGLVLAPGFIDIHIHGGAGHDVMESDASALEKIERQLVRHGVTAYLPTTVTAPQDRILQALEHLGKAVADGGSPGRAAPIGIHLEGPFISHAKRGVHPPASLMLPSPAALDCFWQASAGTVRMMTVAPELAGALETIAHARTLGVHSSLGHSNATYAEASAGIAAGADHATHTFNAMRPLDHRDPGILGAILENGGLTADIIADGIHVDPSVVRLFLRAKGEDGAVLITDAISATGMPDGTYTLGGFEVQVKGNRCEFEGKLAGSVLTLDRAVRNAMDFAGWKLQQAVKLATLNPAKLLRLSDQRGMLAPGSRADIVALTAKGEVAHTIIAGELCI